MPSCMQRKYIDLIFQVSSKWANWDPPIEIRVGSFGTIDKETGNLLVEGNVYNPEFQEDLDKHDVKICMANYPPEEGPVEGNFVIASRGATRQDVDKANVTGQWLFERGKRDAILIMHSARQVFIPKNGLILDHLYQTNKLVNRHLVTSVYVCPAYSMYLSDKSGDRVSLALVAQVPTTGIAVVSGASQSFKFPEPKAGFFRKACDQTGNYKFTPLYSLKHPVKRSRRLFRDATQPEPEGDDLWHDSSPPWDSLDEDGEDDPLSLEVTGFDPLTRVTPPGVIP